jgi:hypothetical protein
MLAVFRGGTSNVAMQKRRRYDNHRIDIRIDDGLPVIRVPADVAKFLAHLLKRLGIAIADRRKRGRGDAMGDIPRMN